MAARVHPEAGVAAQLSAAHPAAFVVPAPAEKPGPALAAGLPMAALTSSRDANRSIFCVVTPVDVRGRLADRSPLGALGWPAGQTITVRLDDGYVAVEADAAGRHAITRQGHLRLPVSVRRALRLTAGDRLLVVACAEAGGLTAYTMAALQRVLAQAEGGQRS